MGLIGVIIGSLIAAIGTLKARTKETRLRVVEKVFDKRIEAHENILFLVKRIRTVIPTGQVDENTNTINYPNALYSEDNWDSFYNDVMNTIHLNAHWLDTELERELGFVQDYITTLHFNLEDIDNDNYWRVGLIIKQDFIDIAMNIENLAFNFFRKDIYKMKINKHDKWHKYSKKESLRRLNNTLLRTKKDEIDNLKTK